MNKFKAKTELNINKSEVPDLYKSEPVKNTGKPKSVINNFINEDEVIDLSNYSLGNFSNLLQKSLEKHSPIFLWSKERQNNKVRLDNEYQLLILEKIKNYRLVADEYSRLKADEIFTPEFIRNLIANKRMEAEHFFEKAIAIHRVDITKMKVDMDLTNSLIDHDQIEKDRKIAENEKLKAEAEATRADNLIKYAQADKIKAEAESIKSQNELKVMVMGKIDFNNFPPAYISDLLIALAGLNMKSVGDFEMDERLRNMFERMENAKVSKAEAEVKDFMNSAEFRKWQFDRDKKAVDRNG